MYIVLVAVMRLMGKRQIGELDLSELVVTLMLSELAVTPISNYNIPLSHAVVPIILLIALEIVTTFLVTKLNPLKSLFSGRPSYLICRGTLDQRELSKLRLSIDELLGEARLKDIADLSEINYAVLESNGQLSVFPKNAGAQGIAHPIVLDGKISRVNLNRAGRTEAWLFKRLSDSGCELKNVFLFTVDDSGGENLILKYKPPKKGG